METPLRRIRKERGLTLSDVARRNDTDEGNLSRIERGEQQAGLELAEKLAIFFKGEITELEILYPERFEKPGRKAVA